MNRLRTMARKQAVHSHSIINRSRKPAWLKGFAMIDMGLYRRFYRHPTRALSGAEDVGI
ncbi:hypothetical protein [Thermomonas fusca]|uniref:hypothetical protein n=1 Tax=Thermomonas fusca TaxID=215690 RepID=UPI0012EBE3CE|nr:hypothetical protein [Thermomonas fusca]